MLAGKRCSLVAITGALCLLALTPGRAHAEGTHFVLELNTGFGESAYESGDLGLAYGAAFGFTWKLRALPLRFALLGGIAGRNTQIAGAFDGIDYSTSRRDLDIYVAQRIGVPVWRFIRIYGEAGIGERIRSEVLKQGADLGESSQSSNELLLVLAAGVQARLSTHFSIGVRGEITPLHPDPDLAVYATHVAPTGARTALLGQIGVHF